MGTVCEILLIRDDFFVKDFIELLGWVFGIYIGQQMKVQFVLMITSALGGYLTTTGSLMLFGLWPRKYEEQTNILVFDLLSISVLACFGYWY